MSELNIHNPFKASSSDCLRRMVVDDLNEHQPFSKDEHAVFERDRTAIHLAWKLRRYGTLHSGTYRIVELTNGRRGSSYRLELHAPSILSLSFAALTAVARLVAGTRVARTSRRACEQEHCTLQVPSDTDLERDHTEVEEQARAVLDARKPGSGASARFVFVCDPTHRL